MNATTARAAYDAIKKCIAAITNDPTVIDSMQSQFLSQRAAEAGLSAEFEAARDAWWNAQTEELIAADAAKHAPKNTGIHHNSKFNIIQAESNMNLWNVIDGQRMPAGYPSKGAKVVAVGLTRVQAIATADALQAASDAQEPTPVYVLTTVAGDSTPEVMDVLDTGSVHMSLAGAQERANKWASEHANDAGIEIGSLDFAPCETANLQDTAAWAANLDELTIHYMIRQVTPEA